jgi:hypothetical protein
LSVIILIVVILIVIILIVIILSVIILSVVILSIIVLSVITLSFVILSVIILNVIMLNVVAPDCQSNLTTQEKDFYLSKKCGPNSTGQRLFGFRRISTCGHVDVSRRRRRQ